mgnify:CR=1 FL=1
MQFGRSYEVERRDSGGTVSVFDDMCRIAFIWTKVAYNMKTWLIVGRMVRIDLTNPNENHVLQSQFVRLEQESGSPVFLLFMMKQQLIQLFREYK